jgi:aminoglycoside phosphotransferase (APT) family kinase protein
VGEQIAKLHRGVTSGGEAQIYRDGSPCETLEQVAVERALRRRDLFERVVDWAVKLEAWRERTCAASFLHADLHGTNILAHADGRLSAIVDWGDAGWGDPAYDLSRAPSAALPLLFDAYVAAGGAELGEHARGRILRYRLARILRWLNRDRQEGADLEELLHFVMAPPEAWAPYCL